jgi:polyhydroxyalkanoate synthesis regulator phasin
MAKVIAEKVQEQVQVNSPKMVEIKHTRTMQDASGSDVEVVDWTDVKSVDEAISQCESNIASLEAQLAEFETELADYIAIRDAE